MTEEPDIQPRPCDGELGAARPGKTIAGGDVQAEAGMPDAEPAVGRGGDAAFFLGGGGGRWRSRS